MSAKDENIVNNSLTASVSSSFTSYISHDDMITGDVESTIIDVETQVTSSPQGYNNTSSCQINRASVVSVVSTSGDQHDATITESLTSIVYNLYEKIAVIPEDTDKRLARAYPTFIIGRILSVSASFTLLIGLIIKLFALSFAVSAIAYIIIAISLVTFILGAFLVIWATLHQSVKARDDFIKRLSSTSPPSERK